MEKDIRLRISILGLFVKSNAVLMIHKMTGPQPDLWDLPGGGLEPGEPMMQALEREIREETGLTEFRVEELLTIVENFFPNWRGKLLHSLSIIYKCSVEDEPVFSATGDREVGSKGIQWLPIASLTIDTCSTRSWKALQAAGAIPKT
ncbi:NUDIX domain-containing protein [Aerosakkonema funiforme]|uniref:NUDIX domain-containing protein n=1 Tax=Aerosakkonema funiforme FACHB-1375 TaxID=2949571 RepID=A0A926VKA2_9CYAN|nr:NUDIX domain-containing protein [Aerosakkonema funiforme]MBD2185371.1 NUDIX domain-containing protein [Aerosakkonema funiforme FACHB-1375]